MIYLDNAATSFPKPPAVQRAVAEAFSRYGANPGRAGHAMSLATAEQVYRCRETAAELFGLDDPSRVIFTLNCTASLNTVLYGLLKDGGRAVVSDLEHNAVMRPLHALQNEPFCGYDVATVYPDDPMRTVASFRRCITAQTKCLVCLYASNVFGTVLPIRALATLAHSYGLPLVVDAAQGAGTLPIHMASDGIDYLCTAGHKGLYGPTGTGLLLLGKGRELPALMQGGTGSASLSLSQPDEYPDKLESGTQNVCGILGLNAGLTWVKEQGVQRLYEREIAWLQQVYDGLKSCRAVQLYTPRPRCGQSGAVLSFNLVGRHSEEVASALSERGIAVRAGLHCAPAAHRRFGTLDTGTVRLSPGAFNTREQIDVFFKKLSDYLH